MKTGYAKVCINPPYGAPIIGYYQARFTKGIADSLYARAVAFDDGEKKAESSHWTSACWDRSTTTP